MKRGDVWWVEFDPALGSEIKKTRPAIIVTNDSANRHLTRMIVLPLTSNTERLYPGEALVTLSDQPSKAMADQMLESPMLNNRYLLLRPANLLRASRPN